MIIDTEKDDFQKIILAAKNNGAISMLKYLVNDLQKLHDSGGLVKSDPKSWIKSFNSTIEKIESCSFDYEKLHKI